MNRNLRIFTAVGLAVMGGGAAQAQINTGSPFDPVFSCEDEGSTTSPYSTDINIYNLFDDLFGVTLGITGTVNYGKSCFPPNGITVHTAGRIGFYIGPLGSVQDESYGSANPIDNWMTLVFGAPTGIGGNWGYAKTVRTAANGGAQTRTTFGQNAIDTAYVGASDRYFVAESTNDNIRIVLRADVLGDSTRLSWGLTNTGDAAQIGLEFGQQLDYSAVNGFVGPPQYVQVPGIRPFFTDRRFSRVPTANTSIPELAMPSYAIFGMTRANAYGLRVSTTTTSEIPDQTPVDYLDIGHGGFLLGPFDGDGTPMPDKDSVLWLPDTDFRGDTSYVQRWMPVGVGGGASRNIVSYYRTTWGVSDYVAPYSVVVDTPKVVSVESNDPSTFHQNPMVVRVYLDNTRGFSSVGSAIPLNDVSVTLNLPQGMSDANDSSHTRVSITKTINRIDPQTIQHVDFSVFVDPTTFGVKQYNVVIAPSSAGPTKTVSGTINVASQPYLQIRKAANLVAVPWDFPSVSWNSILNTGPTPLAPDVDFQAFEWNAAQQAYVLQSSRKRGVGTFLISTKDVGYKLLGSVDDSNPAEIPDDLSTGAELLVLRPGWNLIANPYNYAFAIGEIVGVTATDPRSSHTFAELASSNIVNSSLAYWDQDTQSYKFTSGLSDTMVPNRGYWIYVNSPSNLTISYPPISTAFVPTLPGETDTTPFKANWSMSLGITTAKSVDKLNTIGSGGTSATAMLASAVKPPVAPTNTAVSGSFLVTSGSKSLGYGRLYQPSMSTQTWNWQVFTRAAGATTLTWPEITAVPSNVNLTITDLATNKSYDMRKNAALSFTAVAQAVHNFRITASTAAVTPPAPALTSATATITGAGAAAKCNISYVLSTPSAVTVTVLQGAKTIVTLQNGTLKPAGTSTLSWNLKDASNRSLPKGSYTVQVSAVPSRGGATESKTSSVLIR